MNKPSIFQCMDLVSTQLNSIKPQSNSECRVRYDMLSDSLIWDDELPEIEKQEPRDCYSALRIVLQYRTTLILGNPEERCRVLWDYALSIFPNWIGFSPLRCNKNDFLADVYGQLKNRSEKEMGLFTLGPINPDDFFFRFHIKKN